MPPFSVVFMLAILSTIGLPGTNGFIGEFLVLLGAYGEVPVLTVIATTGVVLAAVYGLRAVPGMLLRPAAAPPTGPCATSRRASRR